MTELSQDLRDELDLYHPTDDSLIGTIGITLNLYYEQNMWEIAKVFRAATAQYFEFISSDTVNFYANHDEWRPYKPRSLSRLLNRFESKLERGYWLEFAHLKPAEREEDDDEPTPFDTVGSHGLVLSGVNHARFHSFAETGTCSIRCEFPADELSRAGAAALLNFVDCMTSLAPFDSGHLGYAFKHGQRTSHNLEYAWISDKANRFKAIHPLIADFEHYCRHHVVNVGWLTLLGKNLTNRLGGIDRMRSRLSESVKIKPLIHGTMLMAGDSPPIGDANLRAQDIGPLREVALLTRPLWIDDAKVSNRVLNSIWHDPDDRERWIKRFELPR